MYVLLICKIMIQYRMKTWRCLNISEAVTLYFIDMNWFFDFMGTKLSHTSYSVCKWTADCATFWQCIIIFFSKCKLLYSFWLRSLNIQVKKLFAKINTTIVKEAGFNIGCLHHTLFFGHAYCCSQICWFCNNRKVQTNRKWISIQKKKVG